MGLAVTSEGEQSAAAAAAAASAAAQTSPYGKFNGNEHSGSTETALALCL